MRRQCILTVNALVRAQARWPHSHELVQRDAIEKLILPALYAETPSNPKLVVEIDYGGFKQSTDTGLPVRRAAFQALETLLELVPHRIDMQAFIKAVAHGLTASYGYAALPPLCSHALCAAHRLFVCCCAVLCCPVGCVFTR